MRHRIDDLEKSSNLKVGVPRQFESDLSSREIPRAARLLSQVDKWVAQPNRLADELDVREAVRTSRDRFITVQRGALSWTAGQQPSNPDWTEDAAWLHMYRKVTRCHHFRLLTDSQTHARVITEF